MKMKSVPGHLLVKDLFDEAVGPDALPLADDLLNYEESGAILNDGQEKVDTVNTIRIHRGHVLKELIDYYKMHDNKNRVEIQMILPNGIEEVAEDNGGVFRDAITQFWQEFYERLTAGETVKVPAIGHNMSQADWEACAKILVVGYREEGYFPIQLAQPFLEFTMYGDDGVSGESLKNAFLEFIPAIEREVLVEGMAKFDSIEEEDLQDILDAHEVRVQVTEKNLETVLKEVSHKELI